MSELDYPGLIKNKIIHERSRLLILSYLAAAETGRASFMRIQKVTGFSRGNLSIQIKTLRKAGYVRVTKKFKNNKPLTQIHLEDKGRLALKEYLREMNSIIEKLS